MARFAEFFAGIGLVREAIEPLGWECSFANDIAPAKTDMYAGQFGRKHLLVEDIHRVTLADLPRIRPFARGAASAACVRRGTSKW